MDQNLNVTLNDIAPGSLKTGIFYPPLWQEVPEEDSIRVVIADDNRQVRAMIRYLLESAADIDVVGEASNGSEALSAVAQHNPDLLLLDVEMPLLNGIQVTEELRQSGSTVCILVVSSYNDPHYIQSLLESGATGYLIKDDVPEVLLKAVRGLAHGCDRES